MNFLRLVRFPNLLMIALTQYLIRFTIIVPILAAYNLNSAVSEFNFFLIVFSTILIAAGGYIYNDIRDFKIDSFNKPEKVIIGLKLNKKLCLILYYFFSLSGLVIGIYLSFTKGIALLWKINLISIVLLWLYSSALKKMFLAGNLVISFLTALSIYVLLMTENNALFHEVKEVKYLISAYALFAFIMTWIREVIKDIEDKEGDSTFGRSTLPVVAGNIVSKILISILIFTTLFSLGYIQYLQRQWEDRVSFMYVVIGIEIPLIILFIILLRAKEKKQFGVLSLLTKGIMLTGVLSMLLFYFRYK